MKTNAKKTKTTAKKAAKKTAKPKPRETLIEITETDIIRWGFGRAKVKSVLAGLTPVRADGRQRLYDCGQVVNALMGSAETQLERRQRLDADITEERLNRMRGESIDRKETTSLLIEIAKAFTTAVYASNIPSRADKEKLLAHCRAEIRRVPDLLKQARFDEATETTTATNEK